MLQPTNKKSLLSIAIKLSTWANNTDLVKMLLDAGLSADVINSDMGYAGTPLHDAVAFRSPALIRLLLDAGVDTTKINSSSLTPLEQARCDLADEPNDVTMQEIVQMLERL